KLNKQQPIENDYKNITQNKPIYIDDNLSVKPNNLLQKCSNKLTRVKNFLKPKPTLKKNLNKSITLGPYGSIGFEGSVSWNLPRTSMCLIEKPKRKFRNLKKIINDDLSDFLSDMISEVVDDIVND